MFATKIATMGALMKNSVPQMRKTRQIVSQCGKRQFSSGGRVAGGMARTIGFGIGGLSLAGLTYLNYLGHQQRLKATPQ